MKLKTLLTIGLMTLSAGLLPAGVEAATVSTAAPAAVPLNAAAFAAGSAVQVAPVVIVRRRHRRYYGHRGVRRVYYRHGVRHVVYYR